MESEESTISEVAEVLGHDGLVIYSTEIVYNLGRDARSEVFEKSHLMSNEDATISIAPNLNIDWIVG